MRFVKYHAQLQIWRPWIIICTFVVFYSNIIEKSRLYEKLGHFLLMSAKLICRLRETIIDVFLP